MEPVLRCVSLSSLSLLPSGGEVQIPYSRHGKQPSPTLMYTHAELAVSAKPWMQGIKCTLGDQTLQDKSSRNLAGWTTGLLGF